MLQRGHLLAQELVLDVLGAQLPQNGRHLGPRSHIVVQTLQRPQILLRSATPDVRQLCFHLVHSFAVQLLPQDAKLALQVGCK